MLAKVALEEAFYYPGDTGGALPGDPAEIARSQGLPEAFVTALWPKLTEVGPQRMAEMLDGEVVYSILSQNAPGTQQIRDHQAAVAVAGLINDYLAERVAAHPDRFGAFASVPSQDGSSAAAELRRTVENYGFAGVLVNGYTDTPDGPRYLDDPTYEPLWAELARLHVPLYLHPRPPVPTAMLAGHPELVGATWEFAPETATHVLRLVYAGVFDRHPDLTLIIGHLGETLPTFLTRIQHYFEANPFGRAVHRRLPDYFGTNIQVTTSGNFNDQALISAILTIGADSILYSVDYPFADPATGSAWLDQAPIAERDRRKIAHGNAQRLLHLPAAGAR